ncbi:MAG: Ig-like domain-containing protein [Gemmatimonadota bacterium]|nr:MAG: Ig-like domain-containing protein [Gemmatimonadota bacterium]
MLNAGNGSCVGERGPSVRAWVRALCSAVALLPLGMATGCGDNGPDPVAAVVITPASMNFAALDQTLQLSAEAQTSGGVPIAGAPITWSESDATVCDVDANGLVTATGNGTTTVMATADNVSGSASCSVQQARSSLAFSRQPVGGLAEQPLATQPVVEVRDSNGNRVTSDNATQVGVLIGNDPCSGTLSGTTALTVVAGEAAFTDLSIDVECSGYSLAAASPSLTGATSALFDVALNLATVSVIPPTLTLESLGATAQLTAEARSPSGRLIGGLTPVWEAAPTTVCTVSTAGVVTAVDNGACTVTATIDDVSGSTSVTVQQEAARVTVSPEFAALGVLETVAFSVSAFDALGNPVSVPAVSLSCLDPGVASSSGTDVTGVAPGVTDCTATVDAVTGTARIAVVDQSGFALLFTTGQDTYVVSATSGSTFDVDLWMIRPAGGDGDLGAIQGALQWDPGQLTYVSSTGIESGFTWVPNETNVGSGTLDFAAFSAAGTAGTFVLARVSFTASGASGGGTDLDPSVSTAGSTLGDVITALVQPVVSALLIE